MVPARASTRALSWLLTGGILAAAVLGFAIGRSIVDPLGGFRYVTLAEVSPTSADDSVVVGAMSVGGSAARLTPEGYQERTLSATEQTELRSLLTHQGAWSNEYTLDGAIPEPRWLLVLGGPNLRDLVIDNALANPDVPDSLFRLVLQIRRLQFEDADGWSDLEPIPSASEGVDWSLWAGG